MNPAPEETERFLHEMITRLKKELGKPRDKWIDGAEAMAYMRINSKTTLQKLRDTNAIRFSQPFPKVILYDIDSIDEYLSKHANR